MQKTSPFITAEELKKKIDRKEKITILDVREPYEFEEGHIPESINIPLQSLGSGILEKIVPKKKEIVTVCLHGVRSFRAQKELALHGYKAKNLSGGMVAWNSVYGTALVHGRKHLKSAPKPH